jgi:acetyl-CoA C-acetyltransferase
VSRDDGPRAGVTYEGVQALKPVFRPDGTVTAGNCCPLNDGAAAVVVMSDTRARELGITPSRGWCRPACRRCRPRSWAWAPSTHHVRRSPRRDVVSDIDLFEINEAFAAQVIPSYQDLGIPLERLNVSGGSIALGHPFGCTGARITTTLLNNLRTYDGTFGLETMCVGGGQGMAMVLERLS